MIYEAIPLKLPVASITTGEIAFINYGTKLREQTRNFQLLKRGPNKCATETLRLIPTPNPSSHILYPIVVVCGKLIPKAGVKKTFPSLDSITE